ncbi:MAG: ATP-binding protein [Acidobacteriota bacterium]|nr:ATP-binding protein [Acidobacteriota bacterium]
MAPLAIGAATLIRVALDPVLKTQGPYLFFAIAVVIAALYGGIWAGISAIVLSVPVCDYLFIEPRYAWFIQDGRPDVIMLVLFASLGGLTTFLIHRFQQTRKRLRQSLIDLRRTESELEMIDSTVPEALFSATEDGAAEHLNGFLAKYSGRELQTLLGRGWLDLVHADDRDAFRAELSGHADQFEMTLRLLGSDGRFRLFKCHSLRRTDSGRRIGKWFGACSDIHNEKTVAAALERRTHELVRLNEALERFAYTASHDLQEPLRTIGAMTQLFLSRAGGTLDAESSEILALVVTGVDRMKRLIRDIMALAHAAKAGESRAEVDTRTIVASAIANLGHAIKESGANLFIGELPILSANETDMLRLFQNLVANAIKYRADRAPEIHISSAARGEEFVFSIKDNGIGIDPQHCNEIFEPFRRLHGQSEYEGSGLGLAACRRIVQSMSGRIWVQSTPGEGSTFFFTIPKHSSRESNEPGSGFPTAAFEREINLAHGTVALRSIGTASGPDR